MIWSRVAVCDLLFISTLFILYVIVSSNPFIYVEANENVLGLGLNPILQHFLFVIHPKMKVLDIL